jgi:hypothetical protein
MKQCRKCGKTKPDDEFYQNIGGLRPGLLASRCKACELTRQAAYYQEHKERKLAASAKMYLALRDRVYAGYGGYRCVCCGETEPMFLTIDHVEGDGAEHRAQLSPKDDGRLGGGKGLVLYRWLVRHRFPAGFQILCYNCNTGRFRNGGICPHKRSEGSTTIPKGSTARVGRKCGAPLKHRG